MPVICQTVPQLMDEVRITKRTKNSNKCYAANYIYAHAVVLKETSSEPYELSASSTTFPPLLDVEVCLQMSLVAAYCQTC